MEKAAIRSAPAPASSNPVARNAGARQAAGSEAAGGFSLLLAGMAAPDVPALGGMDEDPLSGAEAALPGQPGQPGQGFAPIEAIPEPGILSLASLVGQTARMDGAADAAQRDGRILPDGEGPRRSAALPMGAGQPAGVLQASAGGASSAFGRAGADTGTTLPQVMADSSAAVAGSAGPLPAPAERGAQPHALAALLAQMEPEPQPVAGTPVPTGPAAAGAAPGSGAAPATGAGSADSSAVTSAADAQPDAAAADAVLSLPDDTWADQLSEQVAFWVQQKTQRAEMTIDRQGKPVQVQVAITGSEAHVTFRSNEQQTRDMLDASTAQLREMLEQQGLTLAGVTVQSGDAGGQGASSRQEASGRPASRGDEGRPQTAQVSVDLRARPDTRRTVDLFV